MKYLLSFLLFFPLMIMAAPPGEWGTLGLVPHNAPPPKKSLALLQAIFKKRKFHVTKPLIQLLGSEWGIPDLLYPKVLLFFQHLNQDIQDPECLTKMLNNNKVHICNFMSRSDWSIAYVASMERVDSFASMYHNQGLPFARDVRNIITWPEWKTDSGDFNHKLFKSFAKTHHGLGAPTKEDVKQFLLSENLDAVDTVDPVEIVDTVDAVDPVDHPVEIDDIATALSDYHTLKATEKLEALRSALKKNNMCLTQSHAQLLGSVKPQVRDALYKNMLLFFQNLHPDIQDPECLTKMLHGNSWYLLEFICLSNESDIIYLASHKLLQSFVFMYHNKGLPKVEDINDMLLWPEWETDSNGFNQELFQSFAKNHRGIGAPAREDVQQFLLSQNVKAVTIEPLTDSGKLFSTENEQPINCKKLKCSRKKSKKLTQN